MISTGAGASEPDLARYRRFSLLMTSLVGTLFIPQFLPDDETCTSGLPAKEKDKDTEENLPPIYEGTTPDEAGVGAREGLASLVPDQGASFRLRTGKTSPVSGQRTSGSDCKADRKDCAAGQPGIHQQAGEHRSSIEEMPTDKALIGNLRLHWSAPVCQKAEPLRTKNPPTTFFGFSPHSPYNSRSKSEDPL